MSRLLVVVPPFGCCKRIAIAAGGRGDKGFELGGGHRYLSDGTVLGKE